MSIDSIYKGIFEKFTSGIPAKKVLKTDCYNEAYLTPVASKDNVILEIDSNIIAVAEDRGFKIDYGDIRDLPYKDGQFEAVIDLSTIDHIYEYEKAIKEYKRVLCKGGKVFIVVWTAPESGPTQITHKYEEFDEVFCKYFKGVKRGFIEHSLGDNDQAKLATFEGRK